LGAYGFSHPALNPVPVNRFAKRSRNRKPKSRNTATLLFVQTKRYEVTAGHAGTRLIDLAVLGRLENPAGTRQRQRIFRGA
jgi:hypothetical protein